MQSTNASARTHVVNALTLACLFAVTQFAMAQSATVDGTTDVLTIRIAEDGVCHFLDDSTPCERLGNYLAEKHLAKNGQIHIVVDRASKYELVAATLKSLQGTGFEVGFVNSDANPSP